MITSINGQPASWTPEILAKWEIEWAKTGDVRPYSVTVSRCNYFTPRPYVDHYNLGDTKEGFVYVIGSFLAGFKVAMSVVTGGIPWIVSHPRRGKESHE